MEAQIINIKAQQISRDDLDAVITGLEIACGGNRIQVSETYDLIVGDDRQATALAALFGNPSRNRKGNWKKGDARKASKPAKGMTSHSYRFEATGEIITTQALNKRLKAQDVPQGTVLINAKNERFVVSPNADENGPEWLCRMNTDGEPA